jgi:hypothetical protein
MDEAQWGSVTIVGAAILGLILLWVVLKTRSKGNTPANDRAERATHELYENEEQRRRDHTDGL